MSRAAACIVLAAVSLPIGGTAHRKTEEGNRLYLDGSYDDALRAYTEGQVAAPEAPELHYDIGNVLYRKEDFEGAAAAYGRAAISAEKTLAPSAAYNLGNALFRAEKFDEALKAYRRTLEATPADLDAKRNLELALRALRREQEKRSQNDKPEPNGKQEPKGGAGGSGSQERNPQDRKPEPQPGPRSGGGMGPEEARRLLDSLADEERENLRREARRLARIQERVPEEDW